jgi:hypothetical protein
MGGVCTRPIDETNNEIAIGSGIFGFKKEVCIFI